MQFQAKPHSRGSAQPGAAANIAADRLARLSSRVFPRSYAARAIALVLACTLPPLLLLSAWLAAHAQLPRASVLMALAVGALATTGGAALALALLQASLRPLRRALVALERYERRQALPTWSAAEVPDDELGRLLRAVQRCLSRVHAGRRQLERHALEDPLTRAMNRRGALHVLQASVDAASADADSSPFTLLVVDLDNLKDINDRHGHAAGDYALSSVVSSARQCCLEARDWIARWGGDEFLIGLHADPQIAFDRVRIWIDVLGRPAEAGFPVLVSVGAAMAEPGLDADALYRRADAAMYRAKAAGGSRLQAWERSEDAAVCA